MGLKVVYVDSSATGAIITVHLGLMPLQIYKAVLLRHVVERIPSKSLKGTYYPSDTLKTYDKCSGALISTIPPDRNISFNIPDSVVMIGGMAVFCRC